jgi:AcrR family transcriptional regulator
MPTLRADAVRNRQALLDAGDTLFAEHGRDVAFEDVAKVAGVGKGTLYRHFPTRDHLLVALLQSRFDLLQAHADRLIDFPDAAAAVAEWLRAFDRYPLRSRRLSSEVGGGLADLDSTLSMACHPMKTSFTRLLERAITEGSVRDDVVTTELLTVVATLPAQFRRDDGSSPFLDVIIDGLAAQR